MRAAFRTLGAGLSGIVAVLGAFAWVLGALSSIAGDPPHGMDLGRGGGLPEPEPVPVPVALPAPMPGRSWRLRVPGWAALVAWAGRRRRLAIVLAVLAVFGIGVGLYAFFTAGATAGSAGQAKAGTLPGGQTPSGSLSARNITVSWAQTTFQSADIGTLTGGGYIVTRYAESALGTPITPGAGCAGTLTSVLTCTENSLPTGRWKYTVTPKYYNWLGAESSKSADRKSVV